LFQQIEVTAAIHLMTGGGGGGGGGIFTFSCFSQSFPLL